MFADIYQRIWDADQSENGLPPIRSSSPRPTEGGYIVVDERASAVNEDHRVIPEINLPDEKRETYDLCGRLFDNYFLDPGIREQITQGESQEESEFIDAIVPLAPIQVAKEFLSEQLGRSLSDHEIRKMIHDTWFLQGFAGSKHASGFEHVFVGEQSKKGNLPDQVEVKLGGYHFWYKYFLDDQGGRLEHSDSQSDRIVYRGTRYGGAENEDHGILVPDVVTLEFRWTAPDFQIGGDQLLKKTPIGGFWVGPSPEGLIALGLVRARGAAAQAEINGSVYGIDFHELDGLPHSIRTFFPRFQKCLFCAASPVDDQGGPESDTPSPDDTTPDDTTPDDTTPDDTTLDGPTTETPLRIVAALVNVAGSEVSRETVTLINVTPAPINLEGWSLIAPNDWRFTFSSVILAGGETRSFRMVSNSPQFRNRDGVIRLLDSNSNVRDAAAYTTEQARKEGYTILF